MIYPHFSVNTHDKAPRERVESKRSSSSSFRELLRKQSKKAASDEDQHSHPSLFAMIEQEARQQAAAKEDSYKPLQVSAELPLSPSLLSATFMQNTAAPLASLPATSPWLFILENASHCICHLLKENLKETTLTLNGPMFANTPLEGAKLIVREYSTAPLAFNIHFVCVPIALSYLMPHLKTFSSLFQNRRYPFSIHSVDADLGEGVPAPVRRNKEDDQQQEEG